MMSTSMPVHLQVADATPTWDDIANSLKGLLCDHELDLGRLGTRSRIRYEDFETIFCHLITIIDPCDAKRHFKTFKAARNAEERKSFIDTAVRFINDKQLHPQRVSSSQLQMFGGEPFRRLMGSLIKVANERFALFAKLIPEIELRPIERIQGQANTTAGREVKLNEIKKILKAYPDDRYDERIIEEVTRKHFS